jgi:sugar phosphate permease
VRQTNRQGETLVKRLQSAVGRRIYYGWVVVAVAVMLSLVMWGVRSAPSVLIKPLEADFGWSRAEISSAIAIGLVMTAFSAIAGGVLIDRYSMRLIMLGILVLGGISVALASTMTALWQMTVLWGILVGIATGISGVLGASLAARWFVEKRGLIQGILGAGTSAGQLIFLPVMTWLVVQFGWRDATMILAVIALAFIPIVFLFMRDNPADVGLLPYGASEELPPPVRPPLGFVLGRVRRVPDFWLLAGSFFICGATSNGLIGQHFQAHAIDHGMTEYVASTAFAIMGGLNFVGVLASGYFTDKYDPRRLLMIYYTFRGISLFFLPMLTDFGLSGLTFFSILYGLDWIATVPPTMTLCAQLFGRRNVGTVYGFVFGAHQLGAAAAAFGAGYIHDALGNYTWAFLSGGIMCLVGGALAMRIDRTASWEASLAMRPAD